MPIKILVVDDSSFFCQQLTQILNADPELKVIGIANNGKDAIAKSRQLKPDVITMDIEMPVMDGITALKQIMLIDPVPVLMISSLTYEGAKLTLDAMDAGAVDFLLKSYESLSDSSGNSTQGLREKVKAVARSKKIPAATQVTPNLRPSSLNLSSKTINKLPPNSAILSSKRYKLMIIGASTGGPVVIQKILTSLPKNFPVPVVVVQHMPATFTGAFANRLDGLCQLKVEEAQDQSTLEPGKILIAPGGKQFYFEKRSRYSVVKIRPKDTRVNYQPCVDVSFASAAKTFSDGVLALVLTGMGTDGREGSRLLKQQNATVWAQNEDSCVVYGMPMAVVNAGLADKILGMEDFCVQLKREFKF
jgi:two-component system chemotaxis response regulator CheB